MDSPQVFNKSQHAPAVHKTSHDPKNYAPLCIKISLFVLTMLGFGAAIYFAATRGYELYQMGNPHLGGYFYALTGCVGLLALATPFFAYKCKMFERSKHPAGDIGRFYLSILISSLFLGFGLGVASFGVLNRTHSFSSIRLGALP